MQSYLTGSNAANEPPGGSHAHCVLSDAEMTQTELVAMLRSRARKSGTQTSHYRGVSLLKQTGKWHAQINVGGKQVPHPSTLPNTNTCVMCFNMKASHSAMIIPGMYRGVLVM